MSKRKYNDETSIRNLLYHTEQEVWKNISPEHKGYRTALWRLLSENMYVDGDYYVPADELFFNTTALADEVLEWLIGHYNFKKPKKIVVVQPRYEEGERAPQIMDIPEYLEKHEEGELFYVSGSLQRVVITEEAEKFIVAIL